MPKPSVFNEEQQEFLQGTVDGFLDARAVQKTAVFFAQVGDAFFKKWPPAIADNWVPPPPPPDGEPPTPESLLAKELIRVETGRFAVSNLNVVVWSATHVRIANKRLVRKPYRFARAAGDQGRQRHTTAGLVDHPGKGKAGEEEARQTRRICFS